MQSIPGSLKANRESTAALLRPVFSNLGESPLKDFSLLDGRKEATIIDHEKCKRGSPVDGLGHLLIFELC